MIHDGQGNWMFMFRGFRVFRVFFSYFFCFCNMLTMTV